MMETTTRKRPGSLGSAMDRVRGRWKMVRLLRAVAVLALVLFGGAGILFTLDNLVHLGGGPRSILALAWLAAGLGVSIRYLVLPLSRPLSREGAAILVERATPALENRLINAIRLKRDRSVPAFVTEIVAEEAAEQVERIDVKGVLPLRALKGVALTAFAVVAAFGAYAAAFPDYAANAFARYTRPGSFVPPITRTKLSVLPGNARVIEGAPLTIRAEVSGEIPSRAKLRMGDGTTYDMKFVGDRFLFEFKKVERGFTYVVLAGDAESAPYEVSVVERPKIARLALRLDYPEYLGWKAAVEDPASGDIAAPEGTRARLSGRVSKPLKWIEARIEGGTPEILPVLDWRFTVARDFRYRFVLRDREGLEGTGPLCTVTAIKDRPPVVKILQPDRPIAVRTNGEVSVVIDASDDFGLERVRLRVGEKDVEDLAVRRRRVRASKRLLVRELGGVEGRTIRLTAVARDLKGQETVSAPVEIHVRSEADARRRLLAELEGVLARLRKILRDQIDLRARSGKDGFVRQSGILKRLVEAHREWKNPDARHLEARVRLERLIRGPATIVLKRFRGRPAEVAAEQDRIVLELRAIIAILEGLVAKLRKGDLDKVLAEAAERTPRQKVRDLLSGLKDFMAEQKKLIEKSQDLKNRAGEDFSKEDKAALEILRQTEEKWGKFLEEKWTDLSKLPPQDLSDSRVLKELNEAFSEVKLAADALKRKAVEMAIPHEQSGLELAKSITENIERWLADAPDNLKWKMEEPTGDVETPMADLPEELEDLIGDLIDKEEDMTDDVEDVTSGWMDSLDKGAGWTAMDGPISNMSAKGVTGNLLPNKQEVGGRSGEGRSGKSSGQMVEESATGKGGRQTPSRVTPDPYEGGRVKDSSKDPSGGATGGGKEAGADKEGLRGVPPKETQQKMDRLADRQADIRNTAEKVRVAMRRRGYVSADLLKAMELMNKLEAQLRRRQGANYAGERRAIVERLGAVKRSIREMTEVTVDPARSLPRESRKELWNGLDEEMPAEFRDWIKAYYRSLSEK